MAAPVISHQKPHRKRGAWERFGVPAVTLAGLVVATWLAPYIYPPLAQIAHQPAPQPAASSLKVPNVIKVVAAPEPAPVEPTRTTRRTRASAPRDAASAPVPDGFEVLSPAELDAISQARD
jgi:hypothetical protein